MNKSYKKKIDKIKRKIKLKSIIIGIIILLIFIIVFLLVIGWGIYKLDWNNKFVKNVVKVVPYPAASVNNQKIPFVDYLISLKAANRFYEKQGDLGIQGIPGGDELKKIVLEDRLIVGALVNEIAQKYNIAVSDSEIQADTQEIIINKGSHEEFEEFLSTYYDINIPEYEHYFTVPNLLFDKTNEAIVNNEEINGDAKNKIQEALNELRNGIDFEEVFQQYTESEDEFEGALTGNFLRGELPKDLEDDLIDMGVGQYTDVVSFRNSFQIVKLTKKDLDKGAYSLKSIYVKIKTLNDLILEEKEKAQIKIYAY